MDTLDKVRDILKENALESEKFRKGMKELRASQKETNEQIKKISKYFGGFINNAARETEEFFLRSLKKNNLRIGGYQFDFADPNARRQSKKKGEVEIDILLLNTEVLGLLELKTTLHRSDVEEHFKRRLPQFRSLFSEYRDKRIIGLVGGMTVNDDAREFAHQCGFIVLTPDGQDLIVDDQFKREFDL